MITHGDTTPTWEQQFEMARDMFICFKIYDLLNDDTFDFDFKDDIRHAISTCTLSALKTKTNRP